MPITRTALRSSPADVDDVLWCYPRLDDPTACREDAPSAGAWNMLLWARGARNRFYIAMLPRALAEREAARWEAAERAANDDRPMHCRDPEEIAHFAEVDRKYLGLQDAPEQLFADADDLVHQWERETGRSLSAECAAYLASFVALCVFDSAIGARGGQPAASQVEIESAGAKSTRNVGGDPAQNSGFPGPAGLHP